MYKYAIKTNEGTITTNDIYHAFSLKLDLEDKYEIIKFIDDEDLKEKLIK